MTAARSEPGAIQFTYEPAELRRAISRYWCAKLGWSYVVAWVVAAGSLGFLVDGGLHGWWQGVLATVVALASAFPLYGWWLLQRRAHVALLAMGTPAHATVLADEDAIAVNSPAGAVCVPWRQILRIVRRPQWWTVELRGGGIMNWPIAATDPSWRLFVQSRVRANGGSID